MSGNRANAAAIQRRTMGAQSNVAPPGGQRPQQGQQPRGQPQQGQGQQQLRGQPQQRPQTQPQQRQQQQPVQQMQQMQQPQMSVSDAIGLITLRLGRVETYIKQMPPLDQIGMNSGGEIGENMRVVDEAVFTNIVARLEKMEQTPNEPAGVVDDSVVADIVARLENLEQATNEPASIVDDSVIADIVARLEKLEQTPNEPVSDDSKASTESVVELKKYVASSVEALTVELSQVKALLNSLQSFTCDFVLLMQTNQKLTDRVFEEHDKTEQQKYEEQQLALEEDGQKNESINVSQNDDSEIVSESIDLKAFVESAM